MPQTICIPIRNSFVVRNFVKTDALTVLCAQDDIRIVFLVPRSKRAYYEKEFSDFRIGYQEMLDLSGWIEKLFASVETASIPSNRMYMDHCLELQSGGSRFRLILFLVRMLWWELGRFHWWRSLIRAAYFLIPTHSFQDIFQRYHPALLFFPTMVRTDYVLLKEAKKRGIPVVGMVFSWDTLTSKSLLRVHPDLLLVHNKLIEQDAVRIGDYPRNRIRVVGMPQYDAYFKSTKDAVATRENFLRALGGDPSKKTILYAFSGKEGLSIDSEMIDLLHEMMGAGEIPRLNVLVRPYPRYDFSASELQKFGTYGFLATGAMTHVSSGENVSLLSDARLTSDKFRSGGDDWEFDDRAIGLLAESIQHADLVISMYSTFLIEATACGKPVIAIGFDGKKGKDYWHSARRFFDWDHVAALARHDAIWRVTKREELVQAIAALLENPAYHAEQRQNLVKEQCEFLDGQSGARVAAAIREFL